MRLSHAVNDLRETPDPQLMVSFFLAFPAQRPYDCHCKSNRTVVP